MGVRGIVVSNHPLATEAGLAILRKGGNAADAYVAAGSTLAVVEPQMSGLGGEGFALIYPVTTAQPVVVNATGRAPLRATVEEFRSGIPAHGPRTAMTPCLVDGWSEVHRRFGSLPWAELFESAIYYAREGFGATRVLGGYVAEQALALAADPQAAAIFLPSGAPPRVGAVIRQPALARTLELLATGGRDSFYAGETGRAFARWVGEHGGLLCEDDLRDCRAEWQEPIATSYRGLRVLEAPPNSTGCVLLQELNVAEHFDLAALGGSADPPFLSADLIHTMVEIKKLCFMDRERIGDTDDSHSALEEMLSPAGLRTRIPGRCQASDSAPGEHAGQVGDTTYLAVADSLGNAISGIQSLNDVFGAAVIAGETGILLNNRMRYWHLEEGHANRFTRVDVCGIR